MSSPRDSGGSRCRRRPSPIWRSYWSSRTPAGPSCDGDDLLALLKRGSLNGLIFRTDDLEETFANVRDAGAEVLQTPRDQPWGLTDCAFRVPSSTMIRLTQA